MDSGTNGGTTAPPGIIRAVIIGGGENVTVENNIIDMNNIAAGIDVGACPGATVNNNEVNIGSSGSNNGVAVNSYGIVIAACNSADINRNRVSSSSNPFQFWSRGLTVAISPNSIITNNNLNGVNIGVTVTGDCSGSTFASNVFSGAQNFGLSYGFGGELGPQTCAMNLWTGTYTSAGVNVGGTTDVFFVDPNDPLQSSTATTPTFFGDAECFTGGGGQNKNTNNVKPTVKNNNGLKIYPNPTSGDLQIKTPFHKEVVSLEIRDLAGKLVLNRQILADGNNISFDVSTLNNGIYILNIFDGQEHFTEKLIVQK